MSKELWFSEYVRLENEKEDRLGRPLTKAERDALADRTQASMMDRLYDLADIKRKRSKGE